MEFILGVGIIAALVFVGRELQTANKETKLAAQQQYAMMVTNIGQHLSGDAELAEIYSKGIDDLSRLNKNERIRFITFISAMVLRTYENLYLQHQRDNLDTATWNSALVGLKALMQASGVQEVWNIRRSWYANAFSHYVDGVISNGDANLNLGYDTE
jgi:hypothetical protein